MYIELLLIVRRQPDRCGFKFSTICTTIQSAKRMANHICCSKSTTAGGKNHSDRNHTCLDFGDHNIRSRACRVFY
jgi:hypothetical protein